MGSPLSDSCAIVEVIKDGPCVTKNTPTAIPITNVDVITALVFFMFFLSSFTNCLAQVYKNLQETTIAARVEPFVGTMRLLIA
jgi:hypothetical protein